MNPFAVPIPLARVLCACALLLPLRAAVAQTKSATPAHAPTLEEKMTALLQSGPTETQALVKSGDKKYWQHDYAGAIADYSRWIEAEPHLDRAYIARGFARYHIDDLDGAEADFRRAIELSSQNPRSYLGLGYVEGKRGDDVGAAAEYHRALEVNPQYAPAYNALGNVALGKNDYQQAEADYTRALTLDPKYNETWCNRSRVRAKQGHFAEAAADVEQALKLNPKSASIYMMRAFIRRQQEDLTGALSDYRRAIELAPTLGDNYLAIAYIETQQRRFAPALVDARRALQPPADGTNQNYTQILIWSLRTRAGESADADQQLAAYLAGHPPRTDDEWAGHVIAFLLERETEPTLFARVADGDAKKIDGRRCEAWYYAGLKKLFAGDKAAAAEHFRQCVTTGQKTDFEYGLAGAELQSP